MKVSVANALTNNGLNVDSETQKEINEELKKQTMEFMKTEQTKGEKYDEVEKRQYPIIKKDLTEAVDDQLAKHPY